MSRDPKTRHVCPASPRVCSVCVCVQCVPVYPCIRVSAVFSLCHTLPRPAPPRHAPPSISPSPVPRPLPVWRPAVIQQHATQRRLAGDGKAHQAPAGREDSRSPWALPGRRSPSPWTVPSGGEHRPPQCPAVPREAGAPLRLRPARRSSRRRLGLAVSAGQLAVGSLAARVTQQRVGQQGLGLPHGSPPCVRDVAAWCAAGVCPALCVVLCVSGAAPCRGGA